SWYNYPIRPLDPVIEMDQPAGTIRYIRDNFSGTGMASRMQAPAEPQGNWQLLQNFLPITRGTLDRRWGFTYINTFTNPAGPLNAQPAFSFEYQSDTQAARRLVWC